MVAGEVENSCQLVVTFFFGLTLPWVSPAEPPPLISTTSSAADLDCDTYELRVTFDICYATEPYIIFD